MAKLMMAEGADVNAQGGGYGNALQAAAYRGNDKMAELLIAQGADVNVQGGRYGNALQAAALRGFDKMAELLIANGADINAQGGRYGTALHAATLRADVLIISRLLNHHANCKLIDSHSWSVLDLILYKCDPRMKEVFALHEVDLSISQSTCLAPSALVKVKDTSTVLITDGGLRISTSKYCL
jgi:ankyrin repeat protein